MIPAGYQLKHIISKPDWLESDTVEKIFSLSDCCSNFAVDIQQTFNHNGFGLAYAPDLIWQLVQEASLDISKAQLFYYEVYEYEMHSESFDNLAPQWMPLSKLPSSHQDEIIRTPKKYNLLGFDIATFNDFLECSPLSCNSMAKELKVNKYCLFESLTEAVRALENRAFTTCEPGIYKIFSVHSVEEV